MKKQLLLTVFFLALYGMNGQNAFDKRSIKKNTEPPAFLKTAPINGAHWQQPNTSRPALDPGQGIKREVNLHWNETKRRSVTDPLLAAGEAISYLKQVGTGIDADFNTDNLQMFASTVDAQGISHIKFQQVFHGIEVYGSEIFVHLSAGETNAHGLWYDIPADFNTTASVTLDIAVKTSLESITPEFGFRALTAEEKKILGYNTPQSDLMIVMHEGKVVLCYDIIVRPNFIERWKVRVNAQTGETIESYNYTCHADGPKTGTGTDLNGASKTVNSYQVGSNYYLIDATKSMFSAGTSSLPDDPKGGIWTIDANNTAATGFNQVVSGSSNFSNPKGVSAHTNSGIAFDYYKNTFARNSINGAGGTIISVINVSDQNGQALDNAYWNGSFMAYGNGKTSFKPLAGSMDVAGHEMTHGVIEKSANLEYKDQPGAINESIADVFGCMMDRTDWKLGEDIMKPGASVTGALRDMQDPHNGGNSLSDNFFQPKHMSEFYTGTQDNGGVHINSGIPNHAFYLFATAVTREKAEQVYYKALTVYLTKTSQFKDLREAVIKAATDLYGSTVAVEAGTAFDAVGIYGPPVNGGPIGNNVADLPVNPGNDFVLYYDLDPSVIYSLTKLSSTSAVGQITRDIKKKPSVMDDGTYCVYVGSDSRIYSLKLDGSKTESVLSNQTIWGNVAISKDGKRLAAITTSVDTSIYIYDFGKAQWQQFKLYNPTYSGVNSGGVLYADALEWDHTGTKVMYDANNIINNNGGNDYTYWDVGVMEVWSLATNNWANGKIEKLFSSLPDNVSIGNAVFSQRSPYIVAFDYINSATNTYQVMGYNLNTNKTGTIFTGTDVGYPCFSRNDNILLFNAFNTSSQEVVAQIGLNTDKITPSGNATVLVGLAKWGVWFADGTRPLLFSNKDITSFAFQGLNPPVNATISGTNITCTVPGNTDLTSLVPSFANSAYSYVKRGSVVQTSGVTANNFTSTVVYTVVAQDGTTKDYNVTVSKNTVSVQDVKAHAMLVYPNPANSELNIQYDGVIDLVKVYNITGQVMLEQKGSSRTMSLSLHDLKPGLYFASISTPEGEKVYRFTKE